MGTLAESRPASGDRRAMLRVSAGTLFFPGVQAVEASVHGAHSPSGTVESLPSVLRDKSSATDWCGFLSALCTHPSPSWCSRTSGSRGANVVGGATSVAPFLTHQFSSPHLPWPRLPTPLHWVRSSLAVSASAPAHRGLRSHCPWGAHHGGTIDHPAVPETWGFPPPLTPTSGRALPPASIFLDMGSRVLALLHR